MKRNTIAHALLGLAIFGTAATVVAGPAHVSAHKAASPLLQPARHLVQPEYHHSQYHPHRGYRRTLRHLRPFLRRLRAHRLRLGRRSCPSAFGTDTYTFGFAVKKQSLSRLGSDLRVATYTHFTDGSGRADYTSVEYFRRGPLFAPGTWVNTDPLTRGITRLLLGDNGDGSYGVHSFGACVPTDCDGGSANTVATSAYADTVTYTYSFKTATYTLTNAGPYLRAAVVNHFTDGTNRDYNAVYYFRLQPTIAAGTWVNTDPATRDITRIGIVQQADGSLVMHGYGACHPTDCDWGTAPLTLSSGGQYAATYTFSFAIVQLTLTQTGSTLHATTATHFTDSSGRADFTTSDDLHPRLTLSCPRPHRHTPP